MSETIPSRMKVAEAASSGLDRIDIVERPVPEAGPGEILIRLAAASLNYRDFATLTGSYGTDVVWPFVPGSDACGTVAAIGPGVRRFAPGDRVVPVYTQGWVGGRPTADLREKRNLGGGLPGVLRQFIVVPAEDAVRAPETLSDVEAATLPIAALTAWTTLREARVKPGDWVLAMGTGGVSLFALQFAKLAGARVAIISSSDAKLARAKDLGADATVNYRTHPDWAPLVCEATGGHGADIVVETAGTLKQSLAVAAFGGFVGVIGFTGGFETQFDLRPLIRRMLRVQGIAVGSRSAFEAMNRAIDVHGVRPVVETVFPLEQVRDAFALMQRGGHFGKIAIDLRG